MYVIFFERYPIDKRGKVIYSGIYNLYTS